MRFMSELTREKVIRHCSRVSASRNPRVCLRLGVRPPSKRIIPLSFHTALPAVEDFYLSRRVAWQIAGAGRLDTDLRSAGDRLRRVGTDGRSPWSRRVGPYVVGQVPIGAITGQLAGVRRTGGRLRTAYLRSGGSGRINDNSNAHTSSL